MKPTGELKKKVEEAEGREGKKKLIEKAGMILTDDELDQVSGGYSQPVLELSSALKLHELSPASLVKELPQKLSQEINEFIGNDENNAQRSSL